MDTKEILKGFGGISAAEIENSIRTAESVRTARFLFHAFYPIHNRAGSGNRFGARHSTLARMELIPLWAWHVPVIKPRTKHFTVGTFTTTAEAVPAAAVGSEVDKRLVLPAESAQLLTEAYGKFGLVELESLAAETDADKFESILLFEGVMKSEPAGVDVLLEDLVECELDRGRERRAKFLIDDAPDLLDKALKEGVMFRDELRKFKDRSRARERGLAMIEGIAGSVRTACHLALNQSNGILPETKKQLIGAGAKLAGNKAMLDGLDTWLSRQFPSFSFDTAVELATRATRDTADAIRESSSENNEVMKTLIEQNRLLMQIVANQQKAA